MARLLFAILSAAFLVLWAVSWWLFAPALSERAVEQAEARALLAPRVVGLQLEVRRAQVQRAFARVASSASLARALEAPRGRVEAPSEESLAQVRAALSEALPPELRPALVVGLSNAAGARVTRSGANVQLEAVELGELVQAGGDGAVREAFGSPHVFHSARVGASDLVVGLPLVPESLLAAMIKEGTQQGGLAALGVAHDGKVLSAVGPGKALLDKAVAVVPTSPERGGIVERGRVGRFGPILTHNDVLGGAAPLAVASRQAIHAAPYEVVAVVSVVPVMSAIAAPQKFALLGFVVLAGLGSAALVLAGASRRSKDAAESPEELAEREEAQEQAGETGDAPANQLADVDARADGPSGAEPPGMTPPSSDPAAGGFSGDFDPSSEDLSSSGEQPVSPSAFQQEGSPMGDLSPFAAALFGTVHSAPVEDSAEARTVAADPSSPVEEPNPSPPPSADTAGEPYPPYQEPAPRETLEMGPVPEAPQAVDNPDEAHFQDVFQNFLVIRQQCGESADGLTYEKFAQKLQKNREQLIARYQCRTVRFQVYVKEGRAALKATPIKE
jgi:hypothetical protein